MSRTLSHTEVLQAPADEMWEACKDADNILCDLMPDFFASSQFLHGQGKPGSIRLITMGPAIRHAGQLKERTDKVDESSKTLGYTVLEGDPRYSSFSAEVQFVSKGDATTTVTWTATYEPVGDMGPPEHILRIAILVFKTMERVVKSKRTLRHTQMLDVAPDAIWKAYKNVDEILCQSMPQFFASSTMLQGHGEPGSIHLVKLGPAIPHAREVTERMDVFDEATRKLGYTVLKGDPRYKYLAATMQFSPTDQESSTTTKWVAKWVPEGDTGPPEHIKAIIVLVWKALADHVKANPHLYS